MGSACMYEKGPACSKCPENTACTKDSQHPGLCQRTNDEAPYTPITVPTIFNCNFRNPKSPDCQFHQEGDGVWKTVGALGGPFLETILQSGQNATIVFDKKVIGTENGAKKMCVEATYSMGPVLAKNPQNSMLKGIYFIPNYSVAMDLPYHKTLSPRGTGLPWKTATKVKISFAVPEGATPQFFDLKSVVAYDNPCQK